MTSRSSTDARGTRSGPRRVLHLTAPAIYGGLERVVETLAIAQQRAGRCTGVLALLTAGSEEPPFLARMREAGVDVRVLAVPPRAYAAELRRVREVLDGSDPPRVLHSHGSHPDTISALLGRKAPIARVSTVHGFTGGDWKNRLYEWVQCRAYARFDAVVAVSRRLAADLARRGVREERLRVLPNAWAPAGSWLGAAEARARLGISAGVFSVGWVGRVSREKGPDVLVDALGRLKDLPLQVAVLGDGAELDACRSRARALGVEGMLRWQGPVPDAARLLPAFDALVLSSRTEGTPMVLLEAMDAGVPVVATAVGGVPDVVSEREARLVPPEDPAALADAIRAAYADRADSAARAARASARLRDAFAVAPWVAAYDDIYAAASDRAAGNSA